MASINKITIGLLVALALGAGPSEASVHGQHIEHKSTKPQRYTLDAWTTLDFDGTKAMPATNARALYSIQVAIPCKGTKPAWVRLRLARRLPDGSLDTTGTNTWVLGPRSPETIWMSHLWQINARHPVVAQIKVHGGSCRHMTTRQFKRWIP